MLQEVVSRGEQPARDFCELGWRDDGDAGRYSELFDSPDEGSGGNRSLSGRFGETVEFVDELVKISTELAGLGKERRTEELKSRLREVQARFLPSRAIYLPLNRRRHRVYRIAVEESFSFSTKDRAPYLVTLEVLVSRQQQQQQRPPPLSGAERRGAGACGSADGASGRAKGRGEGEEGGGGGAVKVGLIRMLTPKGLGQSLREMADNTLTSLKLGGSAKDGRGGGIASGSSSGGDDVESHPPSVVPPSGGDFLSKGPMAAPAKGDAKGEGGAVDGGGDDALTVAATPSNSSGSAAAMPTVSDTAVHAAAAATAATGSSNSSPPSPATRSVLPRPYSSETAAAMLSGDDSATDEAESEAAYSQRPDQAVVVAGAEGEGGRKDDGGKAPLSGGERDEGRDRGERGGASNGIGYGAGVDGGSVGGTAAGNGVSIGEGGDSEEGEEEIVQRLVPPSFSSTNLV
ncbi:unnamed protein product, partial [Ectocarpus fasciculatus]